MSENNNVVFQLETRTCVCGCEATFKVLPTSAQKFASQACVLLGPPPEWDRNPYARLTGVRRGRQPFRSRD